MSVASLVPRIWCPRLVVVGVASLIPRIWCPRLVVLGVASLIPRIWCPRLVVLGVASLIPRIWCPSRRVVLSGGVGFDCKDVVFEASAGAVTACRSVSCVAFARSTASVRLGWFDPVWVLLRWWFDLAWALPRLSVPLRGRVVCAAFQGLLLLIRCCALVLEHWKKSHHSRG